MRPLLILLALLGFVGWASGQTITVDGNISDWTDPNSIHTDAEGDGPGVAQVRNWGFHYSPWTQTEPASLYWFVELDCTAVGGTMQGFDEGANHQWTGLWIDVDHYSGPATYGWGPWRTKDNGRIDYATGWSAPSGVSMSADAVPSEWTTGRGHLGIDVAAELGTNTAAGGEGYNYWGKEDNAGERGNAISVGSPRYAWSGAYLEGRVKLSDVVDEVILYPDYIAGNFRNGHVTGLWKIAAASECTTAGGGLGVDGTDPIYVPIIPDPEDVGICNMKAFQRLSVNYLLTNLNPPPDSWEQGDYDLDGDVDLKDFQFLSVTYLYNIYHMGPGGSAGVPEPITLVLLGAGALLLRRKA